MNRAEILGLISRFTREVVPNLDDHIFVDTDRLMDLGANSVERAEIVMLVQEHLCLSIPRIEMFGPSNVGELADLFLSKLRAK